MALPSAQTLQLLASETGFQPGALEKALRLLDLLREIAGDPILSDRLALHGGTALNLFHRDFDRMSVPSSVWPSRFHILPIQLLCCNVHG